MAAVTRQSLKVETPPLANKELAEEASTKPHGQIATDELELDKEGRNSYLDQLHWLNQKVEVTLVSSSLGPEDETRRVVIGVDGKDFPFMLGEPKLVPRFVLEHLAVTKRDNLKFTTKKDNTGQPFNVTHRGYVLKHPHSYRSLESNPAKALAETKWYQNCLKRHF